MVWFGFSIDCGFFFFFLLFMLLICLGTVTKQNNTFFLVLRCQKYKENKTRKTQLNLWNTNKTKFSKRYDPILDFSSNTNWCKPCDHVVTSPTSKKDKSWKAKESGLIEVWHNENLSKGTNTIGIRTST